MMGSGVQITQAAPPGFGFGFGLSFGFETRHNLRRSTIAFRHIHHHANGKTEQRNNHGGGQHLHNVGLNIVEFADHIILKAPRPCAVMQAKGKTPRTAYHARRVWVFQKHKGAGQ